MKRYLFSFVLVVACMLTLAACEAKLALPDAVKEIVDDIIVDDVIEDIIIENIIDENYYYNAPEGDSNPFIASRQIHPNMPPFTFHRIVGEPLEPYPFSKHNVTIKIYDENDILVQEISGLYQYTSPFNALPDEWMQLSFINLNFDGYLDMRLFSYLISERGNGWGRHYHWLWDSNLGQFVFNEQLTDRLTSVHIIVDEEAKSWRFGWAQNAGNTQVVHHYSYINGEFVETRREETNFVRLQESHDRDDTLAIHVDSWKLFDTFESGDPRMKHISIYTWDFELIQEMRDIRTNLHETFFSPPPTPAATVGFATFDVHLVDYNGDGYLDLAVALWTGGTMRNSPRMYWIWCPEQNIFVRNHFLERLSDESTVSSNGDGTVTTQTYYGSGQWSIRIFNYDGGFSYENNQN
ncbi:MAG: hypothetical protein FWC76_06145 [Defluviitaleaceae bacterium]|nr:hypothetical protein [Defluviitaleaceae bacterium]